MISSYIKFTVRISRDHCTQATSQSYSNPDITSIESQPGNTWLNLGLWDYREKTWDYGTTPCLKLGFQKSGFNLGLWISNPTILVDIMTSSKQVIF